MDTDHKTTLEQILTVKKTQIEMVMDRGYKIPTQEMDILNMDLQSFQQYLITLKNNQKDKNLHWISLLTNTYTKDTPEGAESLLVYYGSKYFSGDHKQISNEVINDFIDKVDLLQNVSIVKSILIVDTNLSPKSLNTINNLDFPCQLFYFDELMYNPTRHLDVPRHELVPQDQVKQLLKDLKVELSNLLLIRHDDPIVKYYNWNIGDVIRIYRKDDYINILASETVNYRVVV